MNDKPDVNTKKALLAAAVEVFADKGFDAATVRDICRKAEANVAAVNYHYGGKEALYAAVLEEVFPKDECRLNEQDAASPTDALKEFIRELAYDIYQRSDTAAVQRWTIFLREMAKPSRNLDFIVKRQVQPRANALRDILADLLGPDAPDHVIAFASSNIWAIVLYHLMMQPIMAHMTPKRPEVHEYMEAYVEQVTGFALGGLEAVKENLAR